MKDIRNSMVSVRYVMKYQTMGVYTNKFLSRPAFRISQLIDCIMETPSVRTSNIVISLEEEKRVYKDLVMNFNEYNEKGREYEVVLHSYRPWMDLIEKAKKEANDKFKNDTYIDEYLNEYVFSKYQDQVLNSIGINIINGKIPIDIGTGEFPITVNVYPGRKRNYVSFLNPMFILDDVFVKKSIEKLSFDYIEHVPNINK